MCRFQTTSRNLFVLLIVLLFGFNWHVFGFDLMEEISSEFKKYYDAGYSDSYLEAPYVSKYSKDPYGDSLKNAKSMSMQQRIAGVEYVEEALSSLNCSVNQDKVWGILYYFVPEFRAEVARNMKMEMGEVGSYKFVFDEDVVLGYCREYYLNCVMFDGDWKTTYKGLSTGDNKITANTPEDIKTNCQEFFQRTYLEGQDNEKRVQNLQTSQLGADKYWNATTDDSPYDVMSDLSVQSELSFKEVESAITPVMYDLPVFSKSKKKLQEAANKNSGNNGSSSSSSRRSGSSNDGGGDTGGSSNGGGDVGGSNAGTASLGGNGGGSNAGSDTDGSSPTPISKGSQGFRMEGGYDDLIEGLGASSVVRNNSLFYGSLCEEGEEEPEPEEEVDTSIVVRSSTEPGRDLSNLSSDELKALVKDLEDALNNTNEKPNIQENKPGIGTSTATSRSASNPESDQERAREEVLNCFESCEGLRLDQEASCKLMCACGEWKSGIFDPEKYPGLGPIVMLRYCTVPAVDMRFSVGGKKAWSLEELINEIYGVVDKLSREGKLGIWTQQYNFLDSTTKMMKVADTFAFSIDVEFIDIADQLPNYSSQYRTFVSEKENERSLETYGISNPINNPATKNRFRAVGERGSRVQGYETASNSDVDRQDLASLDVAPQALVDLSELSRESRYVALSDLMDDWLKMQADYWEKTLDFVNNMTSYAKTLNGKRK